MSPYHSLIALLCVVLKLAAVILLLLVARSVVWLVNMLLVAPHFDPLRKIPGPEATAFQTHFMETMNPSQSPDTHKQWRELFGKTFRFHGFGKHDYRLMSLDFRAISHILTSPIYEQPWQTRSILTRLVGRGVFAMEGKEHRAQRKLIGPAFSTQSIKAIAPIFFQKAEELRDRWDAFIPVIGPLKPCHDATCDTPVEEQNTTTIDIAHWISRATFDVIGLAGFDYQFNALQDETEEVYLAYRKMFNVADKDPGLRGLVRLFFPAIDTIWPDADSKVTQNSLQVIRKAGQALVADKKATILADMPRAKNIQERDILSLLIKSNLSNKPSARLSDDEIIDQLSTFLFAGSDSTSLAIAWCLHLLSQNPDMQVRLRNEILSLPQSYTSNSTSRPGSPDSGYDSSSGAADMHPTTQTHSDALDTLPFLDAVIRETLRLCPPVHSTIRVATANDVIPVSSPVSLRDGSTVGTDSGIPIRKGSYIHIPIEGLNMSEDVWGTDAREFKPDRWMNLPATARAPNHPGLANVMTFSFGTHGCPGYRFSILEIKIFLATLLSAFVFRRADGVEIAKSNLILTRPFVKGKWSEGSQLPISVERFSA